MTITDTITSEIIEAYSQCPRKAFLILYTDEKAVPHDYVLILERLRSINRLKYMSALGQQNLDIGSYAVDGLGNGHKVVIEATLKDKGFQAYCDVLTRVERKSAAQKYTYEPAIVVGTHRISKEQKLELFFAGYVLGEIQGAFPSSGSIVAMGGQVHRLRMENGLKVLKPLITHLSQWITTSPSDPPPVILGKHCPSCQFRKLCHDQAEKDDDLSLLDRMTPKLIRQYREKGIFTIKQLSFLFKPRRDRKRKRKTVAVHKLELQALALRTGKIYLEELPDLPKHPIELFLDIEGIPDRNFHYLMGLLICEGDRRSYQSFWADPPQDEALAWHQLIEMINQYPGAPVYHYGSYEGKAIRQMAKKNQADYEGFKQRLINLNEYIYGKVYFPVRSNRLKELGGFIGASWTSSDASGLQSLVWRYSWEETRNNEHKQMLIRYNQEDCEAAKLLVDELRKIADVADSHPDIDFADHPKQHATEVGREIHSQFQAILKFAHADYDRNKISFRHQEKGVIKKEKPGARKGHQWHYKKAPETQDIIHLPQRQKCPVCADEPLRASKKISQKTIIDLVFIQGGYRKTIIKYEGIQGCCRQCGHYYAPEFCDEYGIQLLGRGYRLEYGRGLKSWLIYQRLCLQLPLEKIVQSLEELFGERISLGTILYAVRSFASYYSDTEKLLLQRILESPFIHIDETKISIRGTGQYVWVFTDGKHVILRITETREATIVHETIAGYGGVIVTDFYGGYDSVNCRQQKCLVHLIRDLNDDLWKSPFDTEFELFVQEVRHLIIPILEAVDENGLKKEHLGKFRERVDQFYERVIHDQDYHSELTIKYQKRFKRYRESLFTFLACDGVPWNNNAAERALRHLTVQEKISGSFFASFVQDYLLLLGIMQTCRFQKRSFLKFLLSGEKDVDKFEAAKPIESSRVVGSPTSTEEK